MNTAPTPVTVTIPTIKNMVIHLDMKRAYDFDGYVSNGDMTFLPELFPAAMITKWYPTHVTLFGNGKAMITGVKSFSELRSIICALDSFVEDQKRFVTPRVYNEKREKLYMYPKKKG